MFAYFRVDLHQGHEDDDDDDDDGDDDDDNDVDDGDNDDDSDNDKFDDWYDDDDDITNAWWYLDAYLWWPNFDEKISINFQLYFQLYSKTDFSLKKWKSLSRALFQVQRSRWKWRIDCWQSKRNEIVLKW